MIGLDCFFWNISFLLIRDFYFFVLRSLFGFFLNQRHLFVPVCFSYHCSKIGELYEMIDFSFKFFTYQLIYTFIYKYELSPMSWGSTHCILFSYL